MATVTTFVDGTYGHNRRPDLGVVASNILDFAVTNAAVSDVVQALKILKGTFVKQVYTRIITAEGATATADVGDGADANGFDDAVNFNAAANTIAAGIAGTDDYVVSNIGKLYTVDDTIDFTLNHALDAAKIQVFAVGFIVPTLAV